MAFVVVVLVAPYTIKLVLVGDYDGLGLEIPRLPGTYSEDAALA